MFGDVMSVIPHGAGAGGGASMRMPKMVFMVMIFVIYKFQNCLYHISSIQLKYSCLY